MDLSQINNYEMASDTIENASSMVVSLDKTRAGMDQISFANFANDAVIGIKMGSIAEVNGSFFKADSDGVAVFIANAAGSSFVDASNAPENTTLYICLVPSAVGKVTFALKACAAYAYETSFRGFYEVGTQNRILGTCRKVGEVFPAAHKRILIRPELLEDLSSPMLGMYPDGLEINARKMKPIHENGDVVTLYSTSTSRTYGAETIHLFKLTLEYQGIVHFLVNNALAVISGNTGGGTQWQTCAASLAQIKAILLDTDGATELAELASVELLTGGAAKCGFNLLPGVYNIKLVTSTKSLSYSLNGQPYSPAIGLSVASIVAKLKNVCGNRRASIDGSWGSVS